MVWITMPCSQGARIPRERHRPRSPVPCGLCDAALPANDVRPKQENAVSANAVAVASEADRMITGIVDGDAQDPFPLYESVRELGSGVHWSAAMNGWVITRYADVLAMCSDPATFCSDYFFEAPSGIHDPAIAEHRRYIEVNSQQFMVTDPPHHTKLRSLFRNSFTPRTIRTWQTHVETITDRLLDEYAPGDQIDLMPKLAATVPVAVISRILGIPDEDVPRFKTWTDAYVDTFNPRTQGDHRDQCIRTTVTLFDYLQDLIERKRVEPGEDLMTVIATTPTLDGEILDSATAAAQAALLLVAGNETTTNLIGNTVTLLIDHPDAKQRLCEHPELIPNAIEEALRYDPPFHFDLRKTACDTTLGGQHLKAGQVTFQLIAAANRDPRQFDHADRFDIERPTTHNRHLAFSHGTHFCLGAPLARMEGQIVIAKLLQRFPNITTGDQPPIRKTDAIISRGWHQRPVTL